MKPQNELALIVAYYLSKFDKQGYTSLGYKSFNEAAREIGSVLDVKPNTIKNMRDEFDPYHQTSRIGWQRELRGSREKVLKSFQETDESTLLEVVKEILNNKDFTKSGVYSDISLLFSDKDKGGVARPFIIRGPTGKAAESFYIQYFDKNPQPISGKLVDCRELGCGYDFEIHKDEKRYFIEVKGLAGQEGGVLFTNKEWQTALKYKDKYFLVAVMNISADPVINIIQDPASKLKAKKQMYSTIQISWGVDKINF